MQPLGVAILAVVLVLEFSKMAKKIANLGGAMTFEAMAPKIVSYIMVAVVITTTVIVASLLPLPLMLLNKWQSLSRMVVLIMIPSQALRDLEL